MSASGTIRMLDAPDKWSQGVMPALRFARAGAGTVD
jgi:hypothetical protein